MPASTCGGERNRAWRRSASDISLMGGSAPSLSRFRQNATAMHFEGMLPLSDPSRLRRRQPARTMKKAIATYWQATPTIVSAWNSSW